MQSSVKKQFYEQKTGEREGKNRERRKNTCENT